MLKGSANLAVKDAVKMVIAGYPIDAFCISDDPDERDEEIMRRLDNLKIDEGLSNSGTDEIAIRTDDWIMAMIIASHELGHLIYKRRHPILDRIGDHAREIVLSGNALANCRIVCGIIFHDEVQAWKIAKDVLVRKGLWPGMEDAFMEKRTACLKTYSWNVWKHVEGGE